MSLPTWPDVISRLVGGRDLTREEAAWAVDQAMEGAATSAQLAGFLTALAAKGETPTEIRGMADAMVSHALPVDVEGEVLDIVGTGGDRLQTVNISTMAALVIAAAGIPVVKHGNRASSSASGSADCLEALGVNLDLSGADVARIFNELGITFIFANVFHPAMRFVAPTRRELGVATAFNILGPLTNPARPAVSVVGVSRPDYAELVAGVLAERGSRGLVVRGRDNGMDELSSVTVNDLWEIEGGRVERHEFDAVSEAGLAPATVDDLRGGSPAFNAEVARAFLQGKTGAVREAVLLNAAGAFVAAGTLPGTGAQSGSFAERMRAGMQIAADTVDSGAAARLLDRWIALSNEPVS